MTESTVPAKLDSTSLADKLRDRIRSTLGELIPEEQWTVLMRAEVERFLKSRVEGQPGYHQRTVPSDFQTIAESVIGEDVRARFKKYLDESPEWKARWDPQGGLDSLPKRLEEMIERNLPVLMRECVVNLIAGVAQKSTMDSVMAIEQRLQR